jgi:hypothetical protein
MIVDRPKLGQAAPHHSAPLRDSAPRLPASAGKPEDIVEIERRYRPPEPARKVEANKKEPLAEKQPVFLPAGEQPLEKHQSQDLRVLKEPRSDEAETGPAETVAAKMLKDTERDTERETEKSTENISEKDQDHDPFGLEVSVSLETKHPVDTKTSPVLVANFSDKLETAEQNEAREEESKDQQSAEKGRKESLEEHSSKSYIVRNLGTDKQFITGTEFAFVAIMALAGAARARPGENAAEAGLNQTRRDYILLEGESLTPSPRPTKTLLRPQILVQEEDDLLDIAQVLFHDSRLGHLIADLNVDSTAQSYEQNARIVRLLTRQRLALPVYQDILQYSEKLSAIGDMPLITIVETTEVDRELLFEGLAPLIGLASKNRDPLSASED